MDRSNAAPQHELESKGEAVTENAALDTPAMIVGWRELDPPTWADPDRNADLPMDDVMCVGCERGVGPVLTEDPNTGQDRPAWVGVWAVEYKTDIAQSGPHTVYLCEDCAMMLDAIWRATP
jgi:hypothetical protein